ncbi:MAG: hypothetical protein GW803_03075, partial [Caldiserica bacterium]|nr:hypothetical protein [Caldisericota bacterium]
MVKVEVKD